MKNLMHTGTCDEYKLIGHVNHGKKGSGKDRVVVYQCLNTGELYWRTEEEMLEDFIVVDSN